MENSHTVLVCLIVAAAIHFASACDGFKMELLNMENCAGDDQVLKVDPNVTISLTTECDILIIGCAETTGFATAQIDYTIKKNDKNLLGGPMDLCEELSNPSKTIISSILSFGLPDKCPVEEMRKCITEDRKIPLGVQKVLLAFMIGDIVIEIDGTHDTGKTCLRAELKISKEW